MEGEIKLLGTYVPTKPHRGEDKGRVVSKRGCSPSVLSVGGGVQRLPGIIVQEPWES